MEGHRLRAFQDRLLRGIFEIKGDKVTGGRGETTQ
jgi:hypothetical protein